MKTVLIVIAALILVLIAVYAWFGGFAKIESRISVQGGETVVYEEITGDYKQSGVVMDRIYHKLLEEEKIQTFRGFGLYYDNPKEVEINMLRADAGCIIEAQDLDKIVHLPDRYNIKQLPVNECIVTEFPYRGKMSIMVGILRVYPAKQKFAEAKQIAGLGPVMEIYDIPNKKIIYRQLINP